MRSSFTLPNFIFSCLILCSCNQSSKTTIDENTYLKNQGSVVLPLDENSTYEFFIYQVVVDTLFVLNQINYSIDYYNLTEGKLLGRVKVDRNGQNGIDRLNSFHYHNKDSLFLFPQFQLKNSLIVNLDGELVGRINHHKFGGEESGLINHVSTPSMPTILFEDELHFSVFQLSGDEIANDDFIHEYSLNLKTGDFTLYHYIKKPVYFHKQRWIDEIFTRIKIDKEEWYFSWNLSDTIYHIVGNEGRALEIIPIVMNGGVGTKPTPLSFIDTPTAVNANFSESYIYGKIFKDDDKKLLHRIRYLPLKNPEKLEQGTKNPYLEKDFEILTYSLAGEFLGTSIFESGKYDSRLIFLGPNGIYLPKIHPFYKGLSEDEIEYDIYQVN